MLTLYISNQSFFYPNIQINVYLDDELLINDIFNLKNQHEFKEYKFFHNINIKNHIFKISTIDKLFISHLNNDDIYISISYWNDGLSSSIDCKSSGQPIKFI